MAGTDRKPQGTRMVLLGAGASVEAGIPASFEMTERLVEEIEKSAWSNLPEALHFVCGALMSFDAAKGKSPYAGLDVERVFAAVELLAERRTLEVSPFVGAWHPAVDAWDRTDLPRTFDRQLREAILQPAGGQPALDEVVRVVLAVSGEGTGANYRELADQMVSELRGLVAVTPKDIGYLRPLVRAARDSPSGLTVATLNYDRGIEEACAADDVSVQTGIERWVDHRIWEWPQSGVRLLKLHGSIDWAWEEEHAEGHMRRDTIAVSGDPSREPRRPAVVFGARSKLRAAGPFLSLLGELERMLSTACELVVVGYSFRDDHINEAIRNWSTDGIDRIVTIVDPGWPVHPDWRTFQGQLHHGLGGEGAANRMNVLRVPASVGLREVFG